MSGPWEQAQLALAETLREMARRSGRGALHEEEGLLCYAGAHPTPGLVNGAMRLRPGLTPAEVRQRAKAFFSTRRRGWLLWAAHGRDDDLIKATGQDPDGEDPEMVLLAEPAARPLPRGVTVRRVVAETGRRTFVDIAAAAYADEVEPAVWTSTYPNDASLVAPTIAAFIADVDGSPAACAAMYLSHRVAVIIHVGTLPEARGRGLGEAVTRTAVAEGFKRGATMSSLQATVLGEPVYRRIGFREIGRWSWFAHRPSS